MCSLLSGMRHAMNFKARIRGDNIMAGSGMWDTINLKAGVRD